MIRRKLFRSILLLISLSLAFAFASCTDKIIPVSDTTMASAGLETEAVTSFVSENEATISFIDVGQADCILVQSESQSLLIDAGNNEDEKVILDYLKAQQIEKLDYLVLTHGHEDHIGSADAVIDMYKPTTVIMPIQDPTPTTKTYTNVLVALQRNSLKITEPEVGKEYVLGYTVFQILAPCSNKYDDANEYSVVIRLICGEKSFLFMGDAEEISEQEILKGTNALKSDVLKVGHHGSSSSSTEAFLKAVAPSMSVISVAKENDYGHPHKEVITRLKNLKTQIYQTSTSGTIVMKTDGKTIVVTETVKANSDNASAPDQSFEYIGNKNSKVFHRPSCKSLPAERNRVILKSRDDAINNSYKPCTNCKP